MLIKAPEPNDASRQSGRDADEGLSTRLLDRPDDPSVDAEVWEAVRRHSETASIFQTQAWHRAWWDTFGTEVRSRCVLVSRGGQPLGIAPFCADPREPGLVRFISDSRADYCDLVAAADDKLAVLTGAFAVLEEIGWEMLELNNVPAESSTLAAVRELCRRHGWILAEHERFLCPALVIHGHEATARQIFSKPSLRRPENAMRRAGRVVYESWRHESEILPQLDTFFAQHIERWRTSGTPSLFHHERNREFYRALTRHMSGTDWLHFSRLQFEGRPVAYHFGFDLDGVFTWYKPSFAIEQASRSPGTVLLRFLLGETIALGRREFDFAAGDESFKQRFTNVVRRTVTLQVRRRSSSYLLQRSTRAMLGMVKRLSSRADRRRQP